jgi:septal ring factor EnvC (AmiA/AmiB activator)
MRAVGTVLRGSDQPPTKAEAKGNIDMDISEVAALLHIHKESVAHGSPMTHVRDLALHLLHQHNAEAKEEMAKIREEEKKEADAKAEEARAKATEEAKEQEKDTVDNTVRPAEPKVIPATEFEPAQEVASEPFVPPNETQPTIVDRRL